MVMRPAHISAMSSAALVILAGAAVFAAIGKGVSPAKAAWKVTCPAFASGQSIPRRYTCEGSNISPALTWTTPPKGTKSFAVIVDDPDASSGTFTHWVVYDLPGNTLYIAENESGRLVKGGRKIGRNNFGKTTYGGPCPPPGKLHHYHFRVFALDTLTGLTVGADVEELRRAMTGHILAQAETVGTYQRR